MNTRYNCHGKVKMTLFAIAQRKLKENFVVTVVNLQWPNDKDNTSSDKSENHLICLNWINSLRTAVLLVFRLRKSVFEQITKILIALISNIIVCQLLLLSLVRPVWWDDNNAHYHTFPEIKKSIHDPAVIGWHIFQSYSGLPLWYRWQFSKLLAKK